MKPRRWSLIDLPFLLFVFGMLAPYLEIPADLLSADFGLVMPLVDLRRSHSIYSLKLIVGCLGLVALAIELVIAARRREPFRAAPLLWTMFAFLVYQTVTYPLTAVRWNYLYTLDQLLVVLAFGATVLHLHRRSPDAMLRVVVLAATANAIAVILQKWWGVWHGYSFIHFRPGGLAGGAGVMSLVVVAGLILSWQGYARRSLARTCLLLAGLVAGGSSGPWLLLAIYVLVLVPYRRLRGRRPAYANLELATAFFVATFVFLFVGWISTAEWFTESFWDPNRVAKWKLAGQLFDQHPLLGIGTNEYMVQDQLVINQARVFGSNPHNVYLQIAVENGSVGILFFLVPTLVFGAYRVAQSLDAGRRGPVMLFVLLGIAAAYIGFLPSASTTLAYLLVLVAAAVELSARLNAPGPDVTGQGRPATA